MSVPDTRERDLRAAERRREIRQMIDAETRRNEAATREIQKRAEADAPNWATDSDHLAVFDSIVMEYRYVMTPEYFQRLLRRLMAQRRSSRLPRRVGN